MTTIQRTGRRPASQRWRDRLMIAFALTTVAVISISVAVLLLKASGSQEIPSAGTTTNAESESAPLQEVPVADTVTKTEAETTESQTQNTGSGEYDRPSKIPVPQIEDPAEMISTIFWGLLFIFNQDYAWSAEMYESGNVNFAGDASRKVTIRASRVLTPILNTGVVTKMSAHLVTGDRVTNDTAVIVTLRWEDKVYGDKGVARFLVTVRVPDRGFWEIDTIDLYD